MITVVLKSKDDMPKFLTVLNGQGFQYELFKSIGTLVKVDCDLKDFHVKNNVLIKNIVEGEGAELKPCFVEHPTTIDTTGFYHQGGSYAVARVIRRKAPWNADNVPTLVTSNFRCNRTGEGVNIYVVDSGVQLTHPEFEGRAFDVRGEGTYGNFHGTGCASAAAGKEYGIAKKATIWGCLAGVGVNMSDSGVAIAIDDVITHYNAQTNPSVINLSWGGNENTPLAVAAIEAATDAGIPVVVAAGNFRYNADIGASYWPYLDTSADVIVCGGTSMNDSMYYEVPYWGTMFGSKIDIYAPAQEQRVADLLEDAYSRSDSGTSFAAPLACGVIACMLQGYQRPTTRLQVRAIKAKLLANSTHNVIKVPENYYGTVAGFVSNRPPHKMVVDNDNFLYLDPKIKIEPIDGLEPII